MYRNVEKFEIFFYLVSKLICIQINFSIQNNLLTLVQNLIQ